MRKISICRALAMILALVMLASLASCSQKEEFVFEIDENGEAVLVSYHGRGGNVTVPKEYGGTPVTRIAPLAFVNKQSLRSVTLPRSVKEIGEYAFLGSAGMVAVYINTKDIVIGEGAFSGCLWLESIDLLECAEIPKWAFRNCASLKEVRMAGATSIGEGAFVGCAALESIELPGGLETIGARAFEGCTSLKSVMIEKRVREIGYGCFGGSPTSVRFAEGAVFDGLAGGAFVGCLGEVIELPLSVTKGGKGAFADCTARIVFDEGSSVGITVGMFLGYKGSVIELPRGVTKIEGSAFAGSEAEIIFAPDGALTMLDSGAFRDYKGKSLTIPASVEFIGDMAFVGCTADLSFEEGSRMRHLPQRAFEEWQGERITLPTDLLSIGDYSFSGCTKLREIKLPDEINTIPEGAFDNCISLSSVEWGDVKEICALAFFGCSEMTSLILPDTVEVIGEGAFGGCDTLSSVTLGSGIRQIGAMAFSQCPLLLEVKYNGTESEWESVELVDGIEAIGYTTVIFLK